MGMITFDDTFNILDNVPLNSGDLKLLKDLILLVSMGLVKQYGECSRIGRNEFCPKYLHLVANTKEMS